jgi:hypothetical protein
MRVPPNLFWKEINIFEAAKWERALNPARRDSEETVCQQGSKQYSLTLSGAKGSCIAWADEKMLGPKKI